MTRGGRRRRCESSRKASSIARRPPSASLAVRSCSISPLVRTMRSGAGVVRLRNASFNLIALAYTVVTGVLAVVIALFGSAGAADPIIRFAWIAVTSVAVTSSLVALTGVWTATAVYAGVFWCFHFGLIGTLASGYISTIDLPLGDQSWVVGPFSGDAAILALAGILAFASGAC